VAGLVHAGVLAAIVLALGPLALHVPLAVLAGVLLFTAWNMGDWQEFARLRQHSAHYRLLMLATFTLTVVFDLTVALEVGLFAACILFIRNMGSQFRVEQVPQPDPAHLRFRLHGSLFFGAVAHLDAAVQAIEERPDAPQVTLDAAQLMYLDATGVDALRQLHRAVLARGGSLALENLQEVPREVLARTDFASQLGLAKDPA